MYIRPVSSLCGRNPAAIKQCTPLAYPATSAVQYSVGGAAMAGAQPGGAWEERASARGLFLWGRRSPHYYGHAALNRIGWMGCEQLINNLQRRRWVSGSWGWRGLGPLLEGQVIGALLEE
jgi:hypothetical protein